MSDIPSREEALAIVHEFTSNENLRKHMYAVEAAMRAYARRHGEDEDRWGITGLLHDFDYERWPNQERHATQGHPSAGSAVLEERGVPEDVRRAILSHAEYTGVKPETRMERSLRAVDELTGFLVACSLVRPHGIIDLEPKSVKKKMKDRSFAAAVERDAMREAAEAIDEEMTDHIRFVIGAMREIAGELGLEGTPR
jgi:putative nucleotidyltransferase with HDIG domain